MTGLKVDREKCIGCGLCVKACVSHGLSMEKKKAVVNDHCTLCGICVDSCHVGAISLEKESVISDEQWKNSKGIWVFAQQKEGEILPVVYELLGKGRELADGKGCRLTALLGEAKEHGNTEKLIAAGADQVIVCRDSRLAEMDTEIYVKWICRQIQRFAPEIFLFGATGFGRALAPGVAVHMQTGLTADCTALEIDTKTGLLCQTRPAFGGNLMATIVCPNHRPQMATVWAGIMKAREPDPSRTGKVIETFLEEKDISRIQILKNLPAGVSDSITQASVLVVIGRGIGNKKNIPMMKELSELLGGRLGCSRPLVEAGWCEYKYQVGQTGSSVSPRLLLSIGVSGAVQHLAGINGAEKIIAINNDPKAPIFGISHYVVVGDCIEVVKALIRELSDIS